MKAPPKKRLDSIIARSPNFQFNLTSEMLTFLDSLLHNGQPILDPGEHKPLEWIQRQISTQPPKITSRLQDLHAVSCLEFPGDAPVFDEAAAWLGLRTLFILVSATAFREVELHEIKDALKSSSASLTTPEAHYSADLCLRHLPSLRETIVKIADGDPLIPLIDHLAFRLPLSSVSLPLSELPDLSVINSHPGLAQFHAERVIELSDSRRALDPTVSKMITSIAGAHRDQLIPQLLHPSS